MSPSAPITPRGTPGAHWHHKQHDWAASKAPSKLGHLPEYFYDPLAPKTATGGRTGSAPPSRKASSDSAPSDSVCAHRATLLRTPFLTRPTRLTSPRT